MNQEIYELIRNYKASCVQEERDRAVMLRYIEQFDDILERENLFAHFTASPWIMNHDGTKVLLVYHRIFDSWGWCGGHCDGEQDFLSVAVREGREESGLSSIRSCPGGILGLDILPVGQHMRRGEFVNAHVHLNLTYLCTADEREPLHCKEDETKGAMWTEPEKVASYVSPWDRDMITVYEKLNRRMREYVISQRKPEIIYD